MIEALTDICDISECDFYFDFTLEGTEGLRCTPWRPTWDRGEGVKVERGETEECAHPSC